VLYGFEGSLISLIRPLYYLDRSDFVIERLFSLLALAFTTLLIELKIGPYRDRASVLFLSALIAERTLARRLSLLSSSSNNLDALLLVFFLSSIRSLANRILLIRVLVRFLILFII
jgi:hypothetical protein